MSHSSNSLANRSIAIIGAGITGACCAAQLVNQGAKVTLYDRTMPGTSGPSRGNAAHIAASEIIPLASPGIAFEAISMLLNPRGALKVPLSQWLRLTPWLTKFLLNSTAAKHSANTAALGQMNQTTFEDIEALYQRAGISHLLQRDGALYLYESEQSLQKSRQGFDVRAQFGFESQRLSAEEIYQLEPSLARCFRGGYKLPQWMTVSDPLKVVQGLVDYACAQGAQFRCEEIDDIRQVGNGTELRHRSGDTLRYDQVVLAAGVWSKPLLKKLGTPKPLEAERGYNLTYTAPGIKLHRPILFGDRGVVATPLDHGIRIGGWAELGGTSLPPVQKHFNVIDQISAELFPALERQEHYRWMGHRPSTPSSTPIIECSAANPSVIYAFGHGHLGLTQGATTAKKVQQLLESV
ncbi:MAG: NAD(P)/FAD-dependent oxidoreductase [Pseudomonadales bacterium]